MHARSGVLILGVSIAAFVVACHAQQEPVTEVDAGTAAFDAELALDDDAAPDAGIVEDATVLDDATAVHDDAESPDAVADASVPIVDLDQDGLDDAFESRVMQEYLPFRSVDPNDSCPLSAILYRLRPHPMAPSTRLFAIVSVIFERDCGAGGHAGDNEVFGMTIDPSTPAPAGILAIRAIAHQNTPCDHHSECGPCPGGQLAACTKAERNGEQYPIVFYSKNKHGSYMSEDACDGACFLTNYCTVAPESAEPPMLNVGEPNAPLARDLTVAGIITSTAGWTDVNLFHYDPWGPEQIGSAGKTSEDFIDDNFLTPACAP